MRICLVVLFMLTGCANAPSQPTAYKNLGWAKVSPAQAEAECYEYINSAAGRGSNHYLCMKAKGWEEQ